MKFIKFPRIITSKVALQVRSKIEFRRIKKFRIEFRRIKNVGIEFRWIFINHPQFSRENPHTFNSSRNIIHLENEKRSPQSETNYDWKWPSAERWNKCVMKALRFNWMHICVYFLSLYYEKISTVGCSHIHSQNNKWCGAFDVSLWIQCAVFWCVAFVLFWIRWKDLDHVCTKDVLSVLLLCSKYRLCSKNWMFQVMRQTIVSETIRSTGRPSTDNGHHATKRPNENEVFSRRQKRPAHKTLRNRLKCHSTWSFILRKLTNTVRGFNVV